MVVQRARRTRVRLASLLLASVTLVTLDLSWDGGPIAAVRTLAADVLSPPRSAAAWVMAPVGDVVGGVTAHGRLEEENARLRQRISELEGDRSRDAAAGAELAELKQLLELDDVVDAPTVAARVVSAPVSNLQQTIELDRGTRSGVAVDLPVVTGAGLVGRVVSTSGSRSTVRLITDTASAVAVRLPSGDTGVAEGRGPGRPLALTFVDVDAEPAAGDQVITSGLEGSTLPSYFPPGLVVGEVRTAGAAEGADQLDLRVDPGADLRRLVFVSVIRTETAR